MKIGLILFGLLILITSLLTSCSNYAENTTESLNELHDIQEEDCTNLGLILPQATIIPTETVVIDTVVRPNEDRDAFYKEVHTPNTIDRIFKAKIITIDNQEYFWFVYFEGIGEIVLTPLSVEYMLTKADMFESSWEYELNDTGIRWQDKTVYQVLFVGKY